MMLQTKFMEKALKEMQPGGLPHW